MKPLIGITGGIGSGKTTVAEIFHTLGIPVYVSDTRAKWLMQHDAKLISEIKHLLGHEAYDEEATLNRSWIASRVFQDPPLLRQLNGLVHPAVQNDIIRWLGDQATTPSRYLLNESALLFEENLTGRLHAVILVVAPTELKIQRVTARDQVSREDVISRMEKQWPDEKKIPMADYIIFNDGQRSLIAQVKEIDQMIRSGL